MDPDLGLTMNTIVIASSLEGKFTKIHICFEMGLYDFLPLDLI